MEMVFRWYGPGDPVTLAKIRQIPTVTGVVTAVYGVPAGDIWPEESILALKKQASEQGLEMRVIESVPVHEDIKMGKPSAGRLIENYCENIRRLGRAGVEVICYNFMPVFDWLRSDLSHRLPDGSTALAYEDSAVRVMNPLESELNLPGWDESYSKDGLRQLLREYEAIDEETLWHNFEAFLRQVIPVCKEAGVKMAVHPDDPPWGIFGLPRIITGARSYERLFATVKDDANGITFCTGSLGADQHNDLLAMIRQYGSRIHFVHARNIQYTGPRCFTETAHPSRCGSLDMHTILKTLHDGGFDGFIRPDHGRMIWGERGKPGYGLYDRALGAAYLSGLWEAIEKGGQIE